MLGRVGMSQDKFWEALIKGLTPDESHHPNIWWRMFLIAVMLIIFLGVFL